MTMMNHSRANIRRDHLTFELFDGYYISIVEEEVNGYDTKELALMRYSPPAHLLDFGVSGYVPLNVWFDSTQPDDELAVDLVCRYGRYHILTDDTPEAVVVREAIARAIEYINSTHKGDNQ